MRQGKNTSLTLKLWQWAFYSIKFKSSVKSIVFLLNLKKLYYKFFFNEYNLQLAQDPIKAIKKKERSKLIYYLRRKFY